MADKINNLPPLTNNPLLSENIKNIDDVERAKKEIELAKSVSFNIESPSSETNNSRSSYTSFYRKPPKVSEDQNNKNNNIQNNKSSNNENDGFFQRKTLKEKIQENIEEVRKLINYQLEQIGRLSTDPKKKKRIDKIKKLIEEIDKDSKKEITLEEQEELQEYLNDFRDEQLEILKDNVSIASEQMIENDLIMLDKGENKYVKMDSDQKLSNSLDILAIFLKSEKILYTEAKTYCEQQLNFLMLPAIFISALTTVLSMALSNYIYGDLIIASLTAVNSFLLAIISYLKLDAKSEAHKTSAYQFDKLQTKCEFGSGRVIFFNRLKLLNNKETEEIEHPYDKIFQLVDEIESKVSEIKDMNKFILPEKIRKKYPNLYGINIFSAVKTYLIVESSLKSQLTHVTAILESMRTQINQINTYSADAIKANQNYKDFIYSWNMNVKNKRKIEEELIATRENYMKLDRSITSDLNTKNGESDYCDLCIWMKT